MGLTEGLSSGFQAALAGRESEQKRALAEAAQAEKSAAAEKMQTLGQQLQGRIGNMAPGEDMTPALRDHILGASSAGFMKPDDAVQRLDSLQQHSLARQKFDVEQKQRADEQAMYAKQAVQEYGDAGYSKKSMLAWVKAKQSDLGQHFNPDTADYLVSLSPKEHSILFNYLQNGETHPQDLQDILTSPKGSDSILTINKILKGAQQSQPQKPSSPDQMHPADAMGEEYDRAVSEVNRAKGLLSVNPGNTEARQAFTSATKQLYELSGRASLLEEIHPRDQQQAPVNDLSQTIGGRPWSPMARRASDLVDHMHRLEDAYVRASNSGNPMAKSEMDRLKQAIDHSNSQLVQMSGGDKLDDYQLRALEQIGGGYDPKNPVHLAQIMSTPSLRAAVLKKGKELEIQDAVNKESNVTAAKESTKAGYDTGDDQLIARSLTGKTIGPKTSKEDISKIVQKKQDLSVEKQAAQGMNAAQKAADKGLPVEAAAKVSLMQDGLNSVKHLDTKLVADGKVNRSLIAQMNANLPGTEGRRLRRHMTEAIWAQARPETGAAITEKEEADMWTRFGPNIADNDAAVKEKLYSIKSLLARGIASIDPHGLHAAASDKRYKDLMGDTSGPSGAGTVSKEHKVAAQDAIAEALKRMNK